MTISERSLRSSFGLLLLCAVGGFAQDEVPTFRAGAELVTVPVVVKDRSGKPVHGLTQNDFRILENGHEVPIRSFDVIGDASDKATPGDERVSSPVAKADPPFLILFFDQLNTPASEQAEVRRRLAVWYAGQQQLSSPTCVVLYTGTVLRIVQQPSYDAAIVKAAIESIPTTLTAQGAGASGVLPLPDNAKENMPPFDSQLVWERRVDRLSYFWRRAMSSSDTGSALNYAGLMFAAWPGEKALIWVTAGPTNQVSTVPLQLSQIKLYALNVHANLNYEFISSYTRPDTTSEYEYGVNAQLLQNMREAAEQSGGSVCFNSVEPQSCVLRAQQEATDHYLLTYETHSRAKKPEWREIRVKVDRRDVAVTARSMVLIGSPLTAEQRKRAQIAGALASPLDLPGLPLNLAIRRSPRSGHALALSLVLHAEKPDTAVWSNAGIDVTVAALVLRGADVVRYYGEDIHGPLSMKTLSDLDRSGLQWRHEVAAPDNATAVRLVLRDNKTGHIGSVTQMLPAGSDGPEAAHQ